MAPFLIAVSPLGANVQPQGLNVAPVNVAVTPTGASFAPVGKATAPVDIAYSPVDIDLTPDDGHDHDHKDGEDGHAHADGDGHDHAHADGDGHAHADGDGHDHAHADAPSPSSSSRRRLTAVKAGSTPWLTPGKVSVMPDPLDLSNEFPRDYRNWASVLSQVLLKKEGDADVASAALARIMLDAHGHLAKAAGGDPFLPRFHLTDPSLLSSMVGDGGKAAGLPPVEATKFASGANFIDFKPCVLSESYTGVDAGLIGLSFDPALVSISAALSQNECACGGMGVGGGANQREREKHRSIDSKTSTIIPPPPLPSSRRHQPQPQRHLPVRHRRPGQPAGSERAARPAVRGPHRRQR